VWNPNPIPCIKP